MPLAHINQTYRKVFHARVGCLEVPLAVHLVRGIAQCPFLLRAKHHPLVQLGEDGLGGERLDVDANAAGEVGEAGEDRESVHLDGPPYIIWAWGWFRPMLV